MLLQVAGINIDVHIAEGTMSMGNGEGGRRSTAKVLKLWRGSQPCLQVMLGIDTGSGNTEDESGEKTDLC